MTRRYYTFVGAVCWELLAIAFAAIAIIAAGKAVGEWVVGWI